MRKLEQTIIENARSVLAAILSFYKLKQNGQATADGSEEYLSNHHALTALLTLAHQANSGMSSKAAQALLVIEDEYAEAFRGLNGIKQ